jgi:hypothetical protein
LTSDATFAATGALDGAIARANVTQIGWSGALFARPTEPPLRTYETGSSRKRPTISGAARYSTAPPIQDGELRSRNAADDGVSRYSSPCFSRWPRTVR